MFFAECVARVPVSLWGFGGCDVGVFTRRCVCVRNRSQQFGRVRVRFFMAVPLGTVAKVVTFEGFKRRATAFRLTGVALCHIPTCFIMYRRSFGVTVPLARFAEDGSSCIFRRRRSTLETSIVIF